MTKILEDLNELNKKKVLFITTKSLGYIRNVQEIKLLKECTESLEVVGSYGKNYFLRLFKVYPKLLFKSFKSYDAVFVGFAPQLILPLYWRRMKRAGCVIAEDFFISLYDTFCNDRKKFTPDSAFGRFLHRLDKNTLAVADMVVCDTKAHAGYFIKEFGVSEDAERVLYITADPQIYHPLGLDKEKTLKKYFPDADLEASAAGAASATSAADAVAATSAADGTLEPDGDKESVARRHIVMYFGSVLPLQGIDTVIEAMKKLAATGRYICIFVGPLGNGGSDAERYEGICHKEWLKESELAELLDISDVCLAGHFNAGIEKAKRTIPGKAFIYEAMAKPIVLGDNEANREYFTGSDKVEFAKMGDPEAIVAAVERLTKGESAE